MSFHFVSHRWEIENVDDGMVVALSPSDLDANHVSSQVDELFDLMQESGQPNLYLDFINVHLVPSVVFGKLIALEAKLRQVGCRLVLCGVDAHLYEGLRAAGLTDIFDIRISLPDDASGVGLK
jgi:anti-anti-sigma factor